MKWIEMGSKNSKVISNIFSGLRWTSFFEDSSETVHFPLKSRGIVFEKKFTDEIYPSVSKFSWQNLAKKCFFSSEEIYLECILRT